MIYLTDPIVIVLLILVLALATTGFILVILGNKEQQILEEREIKRAGKEGERRFRIVLDQICDENDLCIRNVPISFEGKDAELDCVIINRNGVFIIEVKTLVGKILGDEEDRNWTKTKMSNKGEKYTKTMPNPIKQVNRQVHFLKQLLKAQGLSTWIKGYVYFVNDNEVFEHSQLLGRAEELNNIIHNSDGHGLPDDKAIAIYSSIMQMKNIRSR